MAPPIIPKRPLPDGKPAENPNMFIRVVTGVKEHFEARFVEWAMAAAITIWGANLAYVAPEQFAKAEAWVVLNRVAGQSFWSSAGMTLGLLWLAALIINGTFAGTIYSRLSPYVRGLCAGAAAVFWFHVFSSVLSAGTSGRGAYWLHLGLSIWCLFHTWRDVGRGSRDARS